MIDRRAVLKLLAAGASGVAAPTLLGCEVRNPTLGQTSGASGAWPGEQAVMTPTAQEASQALSLVRQIEVRPSHERGHAELGWLKARYSFSFARYRDPAHMGFRALRVINEDVIQGGGGFGMHAHHDMEILTYILDGALEHKDSMGNGSIISPGEVQAMSAGTGVRHSEFNPSSSSAVHLLQIWLLPDGAGRQPRYQQKPIARHTAKQPIQLIASPDGREGSVAMHQDVHIHACKLVKGQAMSFEIRPERHAWAQIARGRLRLNGRTLQAGDGAKTSQQGWLVFEAERDSELLLFDLA